MATGMRRAEVLGLRWRDVDLAAGTLTVQRNYLRANGKSYEKDTKTHQERRISLDARSKAERSPAAAFRRDAQYVSGGTMAQQPDEKPSKRPRSASPSRPCEPMRRRFYHRIRRTKTRSCPPDYRSAVRRRHWTAPVVSTSATWPDRWRHPEGLPKPTTKVLAMRCVGRRCGLRD